jgi:hypothetical protein
MNLRKELTDLNNKVLDTFTKLRESKDEYIFYTEEDIKDYNHTEYSFEVRNKRSEIIDVYIIKVDSEGINVIDLEDDYRHYIGLMELADISDRITLVELMQEQLAKHLINKL